MNYEPLEHTIFNLENCLFMFPRHQEQQKQKFYFLLDIRALLAVKNTYNLYY